MEFHRHSTDSPGAHDRTGTLTPSHTVLNVEEQEQTDCENGRISVA